MMFQDPNGPPAQDKLKYYGKYKGFVRKNVDPENRNRIRCFCPQVMGPKDDDDHWLGWAEANSPWFGGINLGDSGTPYTNEQQIAATGFEYIGVWLEFEQGEVDFPIWCGTFTIAPDPNGPFGQKDPLDMEGQTGGIIGQEAVLPDGSDTTDLNPPKPQLKREVRLLAPQNVDIIIMTDGGGSVVIGSGGVFVTGIQVAINGEPYLAKTTNFQQAGT